MEDTRHTLSATLNLSYKRSTHEKKKKRRGTITQRKIIEKNKEKIEIKGDLRVATEDS